MQLKSKYLLLVFAFLLRGHFAIAQDYLASLDLFPKVTKLGDLFLSPADRHAKEVIQDNEFEPNNLVTRPAFSANPLMLNDKQLDYRQFDFSIKGVLTVVKGTPETAEATPIAFYVSIRREGKIVVDKKLKFVNKPLYKIDMSEIVPFAENGDLLIINPVKAEDWQGKRILKLIGGC